MIAAHELSDLAVIPGAEYRRATHGGLTTCCKSRIKHRESAKPILTRTSTIPLANTCLLRVQNLVIIKRVVALAIRNGLIVLDAIALKNFSRSQK